MPGPLRQPLLAGGPTGLADIEDNFKRTRFLPGLLYLLRTRGADMVAERRTKSVAPLVVGEPRPERTSKTVRDLYGDRSGLAPARSAPPNSTLLPGVKQAPTSPTNVRFAARILLIDDDFTVSDPFFDSGVEEQRCITTADLHPGDIVTYLRNDSRRRGYEVTSAPMVLGGTTEVLRQYSLGPATE